MPGLRRHDKFSYKKQEVQQKGKGTQRNVGENQIEEVGNTAHGRDTNGSLDAQRNTGTHQKHADEKDDPAFDHLIFGCSGGSRHRKSTIFSFEFYEPASRCFAKTHIVI